MDNTNTLECLNIMNEVNINYKTKEKEDCTFDIEIREMLKDETTFFKISKPKAYQILRYLGIKNEFIDSTYKDLISPENFYNLLYYKKTIFQYSIKKKNYFIKK